MQYATLEQILTYVIENKLSLTSTERKFLLNLKEPDMIQNKNKERKIELEDFLNWYNSPIRKDEITSVLATQVITQDDLTKLVKVSAKEIKEIIKKYEGFNNENIGYLILNYARLKSIEGKNPIPSKDNTNKISKNCMEILDILSQDLHNCKNYKLDELIQCKELYHRKDLIEKLVKCKKQREINFIREILEYELPDIDITRKYIELELDEKNETHSLDYDIKPLIDKVKNRRRAKEAILRQDSTKKVNQVIYAASNSGIYKSQKIFNLIQKQNDPKVMKNIRDLAKINRLRKYPHFFEWYATLSEEQQDFLVERIYNREWESLIKINKEQKTALEENAKAQITAFAKSNSNLSIKKLVKTLRTNISKYPNLGNKDTTTNN